jgi:hypothetical protein
MIHTGQRREENGEEAEEDVCGSHDDSSYFGVCIGS